MSDKDLIGSIDAVVNRWYETSTGYKESDRAAFAEGTIFAIGALLELREKEEGCGGDSCAIK